MKTDQKKIKDLKVDIKITLSALWIVYMFVFIYTDYYKMFIPGVINDMMNGILEGTKVTALSLLLYSVISIVPGVMIFMSLILKANINKWLNIVLGVIYFSISLLSLTGNVWPFWIFYCSLLTIISIMIVVFSWRWPLDNKN